MESTKMGRILLHNLNTKKSYFETNKCEITSKFDYVKPDQNNGAIENKENFREVEILKNNESFLNINHQEENILNESFEEEEVVEKKKINHIQYPDIFKFYINCLDCGILLSFESKTIINLVLR
jgi:hypothetical protein